jgi:ATPase
VVIEMSRYIITPDIIKTGLVSQLIRQKKLDGTLYIPWSVISYLEKEYHDDVILKEKVLDELGKIKKYTSSRKKVKIEYIDSEYNGSDIYYYILRQSIERDAVILTSDPEKEKLLKSLGGKTKLVTKVKKRPPLSRYFDDETMSVHLKEGVRPKAKKGRPGRWIYVEIGKDVMTREKLEAIVNDVIEYAKFDENSFIESRGKGVTIVQMRDYRVVIARPPFSDGYEITAVRPIKKLTIDNYNLPPSLVNRLRERAEGILIAGAPGEGKSTFSQALAEFYRGLGKVVKTIESPRDLQLPPDITQYSKNYSDEKELYDIMLLSRPDYTIFDEMRTTEDFKLFIDLRLAGVGMVGVVHAAQPIDAIQRFVERLELGMIPSVLDTVIFLKGGEVVKVYEVTMAARVPHGLTREELSRPVVEVRDFFTKKVEYEFYVFGRRVFVIPVGKPVYGERGIYRETPSTVEEVIKKELGELGEDIEIKLISDKEAVIFVPPWGYRQVRKALRSKARRLKKKYGVRIEIEPMIGFEEG